MCTALPVPASVIVTTHGSGVGTGFARPSNVAPNGRDSPFAALAPLAPAIAIAIAAPIPMIRVLFVIAVPPCPVTREATETLRMALTAARQRGRMGGFNTSERVQSRRDGAAPGLECGRFSRP